MKNIIVVLVLVMLVITGCSRKMHLTRTKENDKHISLKIDSSSLAAIDSSMKLTIDTSVTISHKTSTTSITVPGSTNLFGFNLNDSSASDTSYSNGDMDIDVKFNPFTKKLDIETKVKPKTVPVNINETDTTFNHKATLEKDNNILISKHNSFNFMDTSKSISKEDKTVTHSINWTLIIIISVVVLILIFAISKYFKIF